MATETEIDLTVFCAKDSQRLMGVPFVQNGRRWASNGFTAVCVDATGEPDTKPENGRLPDMQAIITRRPQSDISEPWPEPIYRFGVGECKRCKGTGARHHRDCDECDGDGEVMCSHCGNDYTCDACDGKGQVLCGTCPACDGSKKTEQPLYLEIAGELIAFEMEQHIRKLPNVRFTGKRDNDEIWFAFDGGLGIIMVIRKDGLPPLSEPRRYEAATA